MVRQGRTAAQRLQRQPAFAKLAEERVSLGVPAIADRGHALHDRCEEGALDATSRFDAIATSRYPCVRAEIRLVRTESGAKLGSRAVVEFNLQVQDAFSVQVTNFLLILIGDLQVVQPVRSDTV